MPEEPMIMRLQMKASVTERGPCARRGMHFADALLPDLLESLAQTQATLRRLDAQEPSPQQQLQRKENVILQSDLRAELRRRGAY
jgi:hypothetical protein